MLFYWKLICKCFLVVLPLNWLLFTFPSIDKDEYLFFFPQLGEFALELPVALKLTWPASTTFALHWMDKNVCFGARKKKPDAIKTSVEKPPRFPRENPPWMVKLTLWVSKVYIRQNDHPLKSGRQCLLSFGLNTKLLFTICRLLFDCEATFPSC